MTKKTKYLSYIEETKKHHKLIEKAAKKSSKKAVKKSRSRSVPVTYIEGENIVQEDSKGQKTILKGIKNNRRKVAIGEKTKLPKKQAS